MNNPFPLRVAQGTEFCNRTKEKKRIRQNIDSINHTLIVSPRRYGKTSLIMQALNEHGIAFGRTQFFNAYRDELILKRFIEGFNNLLTKIVTPTQKAINAMSKFFTNAQLSLKIKECKATINIEPTKNDPCSTIKELLNNISSLLNEKKKTAVIFFDEFQDIAESDISDEIQTILREFAQHTNNLTFIISGSHRHMLEKLFTDKNKPFYRLFDHIKLNRIEELEYKKFINSHANKRWKNSIDDYSLQLLFEVTERHSYYINAICHKLWRHDVLPDADAVKASWQEVIEEEYSSTTSELSGLTKNQRIVLQEIAKAHFVLQSTATKFQLSTQISHGGIQQAIERLYRNDIIESTDKGLRVVDPLLKYILSQ